MSAQVEAALEAVAASPLPPAQRREGLSTVSKLLRNLVSSPHEEKYRRIRTTNPAIAERLFPECFDLLKATGFENASIILGTRRKFSTRVLTSGRYFQRFADSATVAGMLNLKAAREQVEKELGSATSSRRACGAAAASGNRPPSRPRSLSRPRSMSPAPGEDEPKDALVVKPLFNVGDKVEYRSDTHRQWLAGTVQKVREGGTVYDLDVKKGAHASKLRKAVVSQPGSNLGYDGSPTRSRQGANSSALSAPSVSRPPPKTGTVLEPVTTAPAARPSLARNRSELARNVSDRTELEVRPFALDVGLPEEWAAQVGQAKGHQSDVSQ
eukprot:s223_g8.t1